jgi:DNA-binding NarL/FixJ family response regulator
MRPAGVSGVRLAAAGVRLPVWECGRRSETIGPVSRRILIVDDHPAFRASARRMLEAGGFEVVGEAQDAASARGAVRDLGPDAVLLDVQLPDGDGIALASELTANGNALDIVLCSSRGIDELGPALEGSGARGFLTKDELSPAAIRELLG